MQPCEASANIRIAIAGDLHGSWLYEDQLLLEQLQPDGVLFVGDLGEADLRLVKALKKIPFPTAVILGNHDRGKDRTGEQLKLQLNLLGDLHCGWEYRNWTIPNVSVIGARPCSAGGGFHISQEVKGLFGPITIMESANRIVLAAKNAPINKPMIILAHSGPTGLGSDAFSPCGRDWKSPAVDWGDQDLAIAIDQIRRSRVPDLVVFGHMHHDLRRGRGTRNTYARDQWGTSYLNAACVPRRGKDEFGNEICHLSWVEFVNSNLSHISHRWFRSDASIAYKQILFSQD